MGGHSLITIQNNISCCNNCGKPIKLKEGNYFISNDELYCMDCYRTSDIRNPFDEIVIPYPKDIYNQLCKKVYSQEHAKRKLSTSGFLHLKRVYGNLRGVEKSNVLLIGPTGCGKTYIVESLADILNVPYVCVNATSLTENGYVGEDVESCILRLVAAAGGDKEQAEKGIVFIDEIDKLANTSSQTESGRALIGKEGVQQALLKLIEGEQVDISDKKDGKELIDTSNILFICGGAFVELEEIVARRKNKSFSLGFGQTIKSENADDKDFYKDISNEDFYNYGLIRELVGRLPVKIVMDKVDTEFIAGVLMIKGGIWEQYASLFESEGVSLEIDEDAITYISERVLKEETGCRGLKTVLDNIFEDILFNLRADTKGVIRVTRENIEKGLYIEKKRKAVKG